jgi:hypothetical protein
METCVFGDSVEIHRFQLQVAAVLPNDLFPLQINISKTRQRTSLLFKY